MNGDPITARFTLKPMESELKERDLGIGRQSERTLIEHAELEALDRRRKPMGRAEEVDIPWSSLLIERKKGA